mmetsp:Transcript_3326/g.9281  ORF Transcript_3326/g.9281 Transcript_3326/m.9281 type:complete len:218 (-) Transcript_3326:241-894(-)
MQSILHERNAGGSFELLLLLLWLDSPPQSRDLLVGHLLDHLLQALVATGFGLLLDLIEHLHRPSVLLLEHGNELLLQERRDPPLHDVVLGAFRAALGDHPVLLGPIEPQPDHVVPVLEKVALVDGTQGSSLVALRRVDALEAPSIRLQPGDSFSLLHEIRHLREGLPLALLLLLLLDLPSLPSRRVHCQIYRSIRSLVLHLLLLRFYLSHLVVVRFL